jgi:hypothetical protein
VRVSVFYRADAARKRRMITRLVLVVAVLVVIGMGLAAAIGRSCARREAAENAAGFVDTASTAEGAAAAPSDEAATQSQSPGASVVAIAPSEPDTGDTGAEIDEIEAVPAMAAGGSLQVVMGQADATAGRSFFDEARLERAATRAKHEETLAAVLSDASLGIEARSRAQDALMDAADTARLEELAESMLKTWGAEDAIVILGEAGASVAVKSGKLDRAAAAAVGEIVQRATGVNLARITIVERER